MRVSQEWNVSFTPPLYKFVVLSNDTFTSVKRNKHFIQHLIVQNIDRLPCIRHEVISSIMANSKLCILELQCDSIRPKGAEAIFEALKTHSTLMTLNLQKNLIGSHGCHVLFEALKTNSTPIILNLYNSIGPNGAQALYEARKTSSTVVFSEVKFK